MNTKKPKENQDYVHGHKHRHVHEGKLITIEA